jgi:peroxiredoxin
MTLSVGDNIPSAEVVTTKGDEFEAVNIQDLFSGKKVALFGVPGAFTPTCSISHLPGFRDLAEEIKAEGVDLIACISVNDIFVMKAWGENQDVGDSVKLLADAAADFTRKAGLDMEVDVFGMGTRSHRYSLLADDGAVKIINIEEPGAYEVSSAEKLLGQIRAL